VRGEGTGSAVVAVVATPADGGACELAVATANSRGVAAVVRVDTRVGFVGHIRRVGT
jgi:hypothetical protein